MLRDDFECLTLRNRPTCLYRCSISYFLGIAGIMSHELGPLGLELVILGMFDEALYDSDRRILHSSRRYDAGISLAVHLLGGSLICSCYLGCGHGNVDTT